MRVSDPLNEREWAEDTEDTRHRLPPRPDGAGRLDLPPLSLPLFISHSRCQHSPVQVAGCSGVGGQLSRVNTSRPKTRLRRSKGGRGNSGVGVRKGLLRTRRKRVRDGRRRSGKKRSSILLLLNLQSFTSPARSFVRPSARSGRGATAPSAGSRPPSKSNPPFAPLPLRPKPPKSRIAPNARARPRTPPESGLN